MLRNRMKRKNLDWSNDQVLKFIAAYGKHPILYDPNHENHNRKAMYQEAWQSIKEEATWDCSIEDLKRKRDSLMAYYRLHLNKIKKMKTGSGGEFVTTWFAFEALHSFLGKTYDVDFNIESSNYFFEDAENEDEEPETKPSFDDDSNGSDDQHSDTSLKPVTSRVIVNTTNKKRVYKSEEQSRPDKRMSETELYSALLTRKLMKMDEDVRLTLMNEIDNLVFRTSMEARKSGKMKTESMDPLTDN